MAAKFKAGDEIAMSGTVSIVHDEEYGRRRVTVRLNGFDYPLTVRRPVRRTGRQGGEAGRQETGAPQGPAVRRA